MPTKINDAEKDDSGRFLIRLPDMKPFWIWEDGGKVRQHGCPGLPSTLVQYSDNLHGRLQAGSFIAGMLEAARIITISKV